MQARPNTRVAPPGRPLSAGQLPTLANVTSGTRKLPSRIVLHAVQKWGKTSWAAQAPSPIFVCTRGEDGLMTLIDSGELEPTPHFPDCVGSWADLLCCVSELIVHEHPYKTLVIDTLNGAERLCHEDVCVKRFGNDWGPGGWLSYGAGPRAAVTEFLELLKLLDRLRESRGMSILLLCHAAPRSVKNPEGPDYDRWEPVLERPTSAALARWADMILFGAFEVVTEASKQGKAKAKGQHRLIRCEPDAAWEAGNRHGLPAEIDSGESAKEAWNNFITQMRKGKQS